MVSLLTSQKLNALVLLDDEKQALATRDEMLKSKLLRDHQVILVSEAFGTNKPAESDIEDLLDPTIYENLARDAYEKELQGKTLALNKDIPRIVKRLEKSFQDAGLVFHKTRADGLFYRKMSIDPKAVMTDDTSKRFEALFAIIAERLKKVIERAADPFH